ncbi:MAG: aldehyde dehydrogenase family protein [Myxococcales bacterium]|nr:aldehyde dehydrogenase family protein [Myxococcales bacterium]
MTMRTQQSVEVLAREPWRDRIFGGAWELAHGGTREVLEPATGRALTRAGIADAADVTSAARMAASVQPRWEATAPRERAAVFRRAAAFLEARQRSDRERRRRQSIRRPRPLRKRHEHGRPVGHGQLLAVALGDREARAARVPVLSSTKTLPPAAGAKVPAAARTAHARLTSRRCWP